MTRFRILISSVVLVACGLGAGLWANADSTASASKVTHSPGHAAPATHIPAHVSGYERLPRSVHRG